MRPSSGRGRSGRGLTFAGAAVLLAVFVTPAVPAPATGDDVPTTLVEPPFGHCLGIRRVSSFHMFIHFGGRTRFADPAGIDAVKLRSKDDPSTPHDDDELTVFGLNSGRCELIFNTSLYTAAIYGSCGSKPGFFLDPEDVAADERGNVFVADTGNDRIVRLHYESDTLRFVRAFGSTGDGRDQFRSPSALALGASGTVYVTDTGNDRIVVMSDVGEFRWTFSGDPVRGVALDGPFGIDAVEEDDDWIARPRSVIAVSDRSGTRLSVFRPGGRLLATVASDELPVKGASFGHVAIDYYGSVYAVDRGLGAIHKFDSGLRYVTTFGSQGTGDREFDEPRGITIWRRFGQIFITERAGAQYYWIGTEIEDLSVEPRPLVPGREMVVSYRLTEPSRVTLELLDAQGDVVHTIVPNRRRTIGDAEERWVVPSDRADGSLPPGDYALRLRARPTYSSGEYFEEVERASVRIVAAPNR